MSLELDRTWQASAIPLASGLLDGFRRTGYDGRQVDGFIEKHAGSIVHEGGLLFQHYGKHPPQEGVVSQDGSVGYKGPAREPELWYLPNCRFTESLELLDFFGFPSRDICGNLLCANPELTRQRSKMLLSELAVGRTLAFVSIALEFLFVQHFGGGEPFSRLEINSVLDINKEQFGMKYTQAELRDLRSHYRKRGFFVLGAS